jgi:hypothetical protein
MNKFNERRKNLLQTLLLILDESMSLWHPKTTMIVELPKFTWEPRKPVHLGTMFWNSVEASTGILVYQNVVQHAEVMKQLEFYRELSILPNGAEILAQTAEVRHQVEGADIVSGGWFGGDAWFGSVMTAMEVKKKMEF